MNQAFEAQLKTGLVLQPLSPYQPALAPMWWLCWCQCSFRRESDTLSGRATGDMCSWTGHYKQQTCEAQSAVHTAPHRLTCSTPESSDPNVGPSAEGAQLSGLRPLLEKGRAPG